MAGIKKWGVRHVNISVLKWGSYSQSFNILKDRIKHSHVRQMVQSIQRKTGGNATASL